MRRVIPAWAVTALGAVAYVALDLPSADLAAATYRAGLVGREGPLLWSNDWYSGHHVPSYSALVPALSALAGPRVLAGLGAVAAAALFERLVAGRPRGPARGAVVRGRGRGAPAHRARALPHRPRARPRRRARPAPRAGRGGRGHRGPGHPGQPRGGGLRIDGATALAEGAARVTALAPDAVDLAATRPGDALVRVRHSPWWRVSAGAACVYEGPEGFLRLRIRQPGPIRLAVRLTGARCRG